MKICKVHYNGKNRVQVNKNGSPDPHFETDEEQTCFLTVLPVHPEMKERVHAGAK